MGFKAKFTFGLIGAICDGIKDSKTSGSSRSNPIKIDLPTTPTTVPTGIGLGKGGVLDTLEKLDTILMDVDTEGEKRGYERAAAEYDVAYERIENEYLETKKMFESQKANKDEESSRLIKKLQRLEEVIL